MNILLLTVCSVLLLGIINIIIEKIRCKNKKRLVTDYANAVANLADKVNRNVDYGNEAIYILSVTDDVAKIENAALYSNVLRLNSEISNRNTFAIRQECQTLASEIIVWLSRLNKFSKNITWQFFNPFIWFYKGIELVVFVVFGYFIKFINPSFDFEGKGWKTFNTVFSLVSGAASIIALIIELNK